MGLKLCRSPSFWVIVPVTLSFIFLVRHLFPGSFRLPSRSQSVPALQWPSPAGQSSGIYASHFTKWSEPAELPGDHYHGRSQPEELNRAANSTLGFSKILIVGLPERSDKRDALALAAAQTGIRLDWIDGVRGETVPDKAVPFGVDRKLLKETNLGSWRGHMNAIRRSVNERLYPFGGGSVGRCPCADMLCQNRRRKSRVRAHHGRRR